MDNWLGKLAYVALVVSLLIASTTSSISESAQKHTYRLATGDRIEVTVFGQKELTGEFLVDRAGNISMPFIGDVSIIGLTMEECRQRLTDLIAEDFVHQPSVGVRVTEFRPIYVLGDVKKPGNYPFRFGLTVLSAVSQAGGFRTAELNRGSAMADLLLAEERLQSQEVQRAALLIRLARLEAEYDDKNDFDPPKPYRSPRDAELASTIEMERRYLTSRREALRRSVDALQRQKPWMQAEIAAIESQREAEKRQRQLILKQIAAYEKIAARGLTKRNIEIEYLREQARSEATLSRLRADLSRLNVQKGAIDVAIQAAKNAYKKMVMDETLAARSQLMTIKATLPKIRELRHVRSQIVGYSAGLKIGASAHKMIVWRLSEGNLIKEETGKHFVLEPGDIVEVRRQIPESVSQTTSSNLSKNTIAIGPDFGVADH